MMMGLGILMVISFSAVTAEIVYLEDTSGDHDKRNLHHGLQETMQFRLKRDVSDVNALTLNLRENKGINRNAPIYESKRDSNGQSRIVKNTNIKPDLNVRNYQDMNHGAFMKGECLKRETGPCTRVLTGNLHIDGIAHTLEPVVSEDELNRRELHSHRGTPHKLQRLTLPTKFLAAERYAQKRDNLTDSSRQRAVDYTDKGDNIDRNFHRYKRALPVRHDIEMLLAVDHTVYEHYASLHSGDARIKSKLREIFTHIVNGVDLMYGSIAELDINVVITGFYVSTSVNDSPWMDYTADPTDVSAARSAMRDWRTNEDLPGHDHAVLITRTDFGFDGDRAARGMAYIDGICTNMSVSVMEDWGFFVGSVIMAHELGHNLGLQHDGFSGNTCDPDDPFIMSYLSVLTSSNESSWRFSSCSRSKLNETFHNLGANDCTLNRAVIYDEIEYFGYVENWPGVVYNAHEQCQQWMGPESFFCGNNTNTSDICTNLECWLAGFGCVYEKQAAAGTPCSSTNKMCYEGTCQTLSDGDCYSTPLVWVDIAQEYQTATQQSTTRAANLALDGNLGTYSETAYDQFPTWWRVDFSHPISVFAVKIRSPSGYVSNSLYIYVGGNACGFLNLPPNSCKLIRCANGPTVGNYVKVNQLASGAKLKMSEVQLFAGCKPPAVTNGVVIPSKSAFNVGDRITIKCNYCAMISGDFSRTCQMTGSWSGNASVCPDSINYLPSTTIPYKSVTQSSEYTPERPASSAIDGNPQTISSTSSTDNYPWLQIEFCGKVNINQVKITNRDDCCPQNMANIGISADSAICYNYTGPMAQGASVTFTCNNGNTLSGNTLKIQRLVASAVLNIAEVNVYPACLQPDDVKFSTKSPVKSLYNPGETVTYTSISSCYEFTTGNLVITCSSVGFWNELPFFRAKLLTPDATANVLEVRQSSTYQSDTYQASKALDDSLYTFAHSQYTVQPWWEVKFCHPRKLRKVEIWNRVDCCAYQTQEMVIKADNYYFGYIPGSGFTGENFTYVRETAMWAQTLRIVRNSFVQAYLVLPKVKVTAESS